MSPSPFSSRSSLAALASLSRRERQIMDILYRRGRATVAEVMQELTGNPAYSTVRAQLGVLETKGHVRHEEQGARYVYIPAASRQAARQSALTHVLETFFGGAPEQVVAALLGRQRKISDEQLDRISQLIDKARREGRRK
jgi:BlaI family penicillinase repressor